MKELDQILSKSRFKIISNTDEFAIISDGKEQIGIPLTIHPKDLEKLLQLMNQIHPTPEIIMSN